MAFALDPRLARGGATIVELALCTALLKDDSRWPWLILVPRREGVRELHDLDDADAAALLAELRAAGRALAALPGVEKINTAVIGNQVAQLHAHVVGRWAGDAAWPDPVWGRPGKEPYAADARAALIARLAADLTRPAPTP